MRARLKKLLEEYGMIAIVIYYVLFAIVLAGCFIFIRAGLSQSVGKVGSLGAAWVMAKLTFPIRLPIALALTPLVARLIRRRPRVVEPPQEIRPG